MAKNTALSPEPLSDVYHTASSVLCRIEAISELLLKSSDPLDISGTTLASLISPLVDDMCVVTAALAGKEI